MSRDEGRNNGGDFLGFVTRAKRSLGEDIDIFSLDLRVQKIIPNI
jgi:hypothetical protein